MSEKDFIMQIADEEFLWALSQIDDEMVKNIIVSYVEYIRNAQKQTKEGK